MTPAATQTAPTGTGRRALEGDPHGVGLTVNTVSPGLVETEMIQHVPDRVMDKLRAEIPVHRLGRPEEIARVAHFLAADASSYITGQMWSVNGGMEM